jgi:hypothetical protein
MNRLLKKVASSAVAQQVAQIVNPPKEAAKKKKTNSPVEISKSIVDVGGLTKLVSGAGSLMAAAGSGIEAYKNPTGLSERAVGPWPDAKPTSGQPSSGDRVAAGLLAFENSARQSESKNMSGMPAAAIGAVAGYKSLASAIKHKPAPAMSAEKEQQKSSPGVKAEDRSEPSFLRAGLTNLGERVAEEEPVVLPTGERDYHAGDIVKEQALKYEAKAAAVTAAVVAAVAVTASAAPGLIPGVGRAIGGYAGKKLISSGIEALGEIISQKPGGLTLAAPNGATISGAAELAPAAIGATVEGAKISTAAAVFAGAMLPRDDVPLSLEYRGDGKSRSSKASSAGKSEPKAERKIDTPEMRNSFVKSKEKSGEWIRVGERNGRMTWRNADKSQFYQKTMEKNEIEVYGGHGKHIGVIKPSDGVLRRELAEPRRSMEK